MGSIRPQPKVLTIWRIMLAIGICVPAFLNSVFFRITSPIWTWGTVIWMTAFLLLYLIYLPLRYRRLSFSVTSDRILLYGGVLYRSARMVPIARIQYTSLSANPFERIFGLCSLVVVMAGGRAVLPGLRRQDAEALAAVLGDRR